MANTIAEAFAPATVANVGVGFDVLGLALSAPGDTVIAEFDPSRTGAYIRSIEGDYGRLPLDAAKNCASVAANALLKEVGETRGVALTLKKGLPLASGLGSSSASSVAAAVAVNALLGDPLPREALLPACLEGEAAVSGYHADNVAPCLLGGITLINGFRAEDICPLPVPPELVLALVTPDVAVPTATARAVLPQSVSLRQMIAQTAAIAELIDALHRGDVPAMAAAMEKDGVIEPARAHLMPLLAEVRAVAKAHGAHGLVISGAGPTLCAVCDSETVARQVESAMGQVYRSQGIDCLTSHGRVSDRGAVVRTAR